MLSYLAVSTLDLALWLGILLRPLQLAILIYLLIVQFKLIKAGDKFHPLRVMIFGLFIINILAALVAFGVDIIGLWWVNPGRWVALVYVLTNVVTGMAITILLLAMYRFNVNGHDE